MILWYTKRHTHRKYLVVYGKKSTLCFFSLLIVILHYNGVDPILLLGSEYTGKAQLFIFPSIGYASI